MVMLSLGLNLFLVLATGWLFVSLMRMGERPVVIRRLPRPAPVTNVVRLVRTNVVVRRQFFSWQELESSDYPTYIANLRGIGCPESTIRDIIVADVNLLYSRRRAAEVPTGSEQWWRSEPDMDLLQAAADKSRTLDEERRALLARLLGSNWETGSETLSLPDTSITFSGVQLGELSTEAKQAVRDIETRSRDRREAYAAARQGQGLPSDPAELARIRQQTRDELAKVLTPAQLEEYLLRYSNNATQLREVMRGFHASPEEFRGVFRATDTLDLQIEALAGASDPAAVKRREELEGQREAAIKEALKPERYAYYKLNQDPAFQSSRETAEQIGATPESVLPLYQINQETEKERQRIMRDPGLTPEQQTESLATVYQNQLDTLRKILGEEAFKRYQAATGK
jgi:hypothetical protein